MLRRTLIHPLGKPGTSKMAFMELLGDRDEQNATVYID